MGAMERVRLRIDYVIYTGLSIVVAAIIAVYLIAGFQGRVEVKNFIISRAFSLDPARAVAAFLLPITAMFLAIIFTARFLLRTSNSLGTMLRLRYFYIFGLMSCFGMIGVSAIALSTDRIGHNICAALLFFSGVIAMFLATAEDYYVVYAGWSPIVLFRASLCMVAVVAVVAANVGFLVNFFMASIAEVILAGMLFIFVGSFLKEFRGKSITIHLDSMGGRNEASMRGAVMI